MGRTPQNTGLIGGKPYLSKIGAVRWALLPAQPVDCEQDSFLTHVAAPVRAHVLHSVRCAGR